jgi:membrane protein required for colicin V production
MPISILDLIVLGVALLSAALAAVRGFTREVLTIASWGAAGAAAWIFYPMLLPYVQQHINQQVFALAVSIGAVFLVVLVLVSLITVRISDMILDSRIGAVDRSLGFVFGIARGLVLCVIGFAIFLWLVQKPENAPEWVKTAKTRPFLDSGVATLMSILPDLNTLIPNKKLPVDANGTLKSILPPISATTPPATPSTPTRP